MDHAFVGRFAARPGLLALLALTACSADSEDPVTNPAAEIWVDVGLPGGTDGLEFVPLAPGGAVPLASFGQGGTHALLAVRTSGLGNRAFIGVSLRNAATGAEVSAPAGASPRLLLCREADVCDLLPLLVMTGGLVLPGEAREGLAVLVRVDATGAEGGAASVERAAVLTTGSL
jgi:hypothetical protein